MNLKETILSRRTIKPMHFNGENVSKEIIEEMLTAANWAPTHRNTEPWRFVIYSGESKTKFAKETAEMFRQVKTDEGKMEKTAIDKKFEKIQLNANLSSHIIALIMKRDEEKRVPEIEEICAVSCAVQNMMLTATANNVAHIWSSGGLTFHPEMKKYLNITEEDKILGFLYVGKSDLKPKSKRFIPLEDKVIWKE
ncbi:MAG: nitroreductase family protein [Chitinophagales bacterium]